MRSAFDTVANNVNSQQSSIKECVSLERLIAKTYTWTLFKSTLDVTSVAGCKRTDKAANPATKAATVVKKPNTPCARLLVEYMADCRKSSQCDALKYALGR